MEPKYARVPTEQMNTLIPEGVPYSVSSKGDQRTLREFTHPHMTHDLPDATTIFLLNCNQDPDHGGRIDSGVAEADLVDWHGFLAPYGVGEDTWLSHAEVRALLIKFGIITEDI